MKVTDELFDPGLQPERTLLAWERTCLALAVALAVGARLAMPTLGVRAVLLSIVGLALLIISWFGTVRRYRRVHRCLTGPEASLQQSGFPMTALAGAAAVFGLGGLAFVVLGG